MSNLSILLTLLFLGVGQSAIASPICRYDPNKGANPLGMRTYITITQQGKDTVFTYEQFPGRIAEKVTIAQQRQLTFHEMNIDKSRQVLRQNPQYYSELVGYDDPNGFAIVDAVLSCRASI